MATAGINVIATLAFLGNIALLVFLLLFLAQVFFKNKLFKKLVAFLEPKNYYLVFFLSFIATLASLFLSEVVKFKPCILCWYQRIAMYPQPLLLYMAIIRNERVVTPYLIAINAMGGLIATYHYSLHLFPTVLPEGCNQAVVGVSCVKGYSFYYGFMTFPAMALTVFALNILLLSFSYYKTKKQAR